jgi:hypothetical protein
VNRRQWVFTLIAIIVALACVACGGNPSTPELEQTPVTEPVSQSSGEGAHHSLGYHALIIDTENLAVEMIPVRSTDWHFNLTGILNSAMGVSAVTIPGECDPANGKFVLDITLEHPFPTKTQFSGFDVKGILITPGSFAVGQLVFAGLDETRLLNADGYTRWWNAVEFPVHGIFGYTPGDLSFTAPGLLTATVNPYKFFADRLASTDSMAWVCDEPMSSALGRAVFKAGESNTRRYEIQFEMDPGPKVAYGYAIDCSWDLPSPNPPGDVPNDFPIEANQPEAFHVAFSPTVNTLYYDSETGTGGGVLRLQTNVHDWQGQAAGSIPPEVSIVRIFAPTLMTGGVTAEYLNETDIKVRYTADLSGLAVPTEAGEAMVICRVESSDGSTYHQAGPSAPNDPLSAYQVISVEVIDPECEADSNNDWSEAVEILPDAVVTDQVCMTEDEEDYWYFEIPAQHAARGEFVLNCDQEQTRITLYDSMHAFITYEEASGGSASINLSNFRLPPDTYYVKVSTTNPTNIAPYVLEFNGNIVCPTNPVDITPTDLHCDPTRAWFYENYLILAGKRLWIYDITVPTDPVLVTLEDIYINTAADFCYPWLFFADGPYVSAIDLTDFGSPVLYSDIYTLTGTDFALSLRMNSSCVYIASEHTMVPIYSLDILDYSVTPTGPTLAGQKDLPSKSDEIALLDPEGPETKVVTLYSSSVESWDVEDPSNITTAGSYSPPTYYMLEVATQGNYVYVAGHDDTFTDGDLTILEQSGTTLSFLGMTDIPMYSVAIDVEGDYACVANGTFGRTVCNINNPSSPSTYGTVDTWTNANDITMSNGLGCVIIQAQGFELFDYTNATEPSIYRKKVLNSCCNIFPKDNWLITIDMYYALKTLDISDPEHPVIAGEYWFDWGPTDGALCGDMLVVAVLDTWELLDVSDPTAISSYGVQLETDNVSAMGLLPGVAYIGLYDGTMRVYDISAPSSPAFQKQVSLCGYARDIDFAGDYMLATREFGVEVYDNTNPLDPVYQNSYMHSVEKHNAVMVDGPLMYLNTKLELEIVGITDPTSATWIATEVLPPPANDGYNCMALDWPFLYTAGDMTEPVSTCICPSASPSTIGKVYEEPSYGPWELYANDGFLYVGTSHRGLMIFDLY